jgi:dTDP-4-amino-4,6-dideoxygalactose transaminase
MTFVASVNVIEHVGAKPVLVDVEPDTLNLDPQLAQRAVTSNTRCLLPVHYAGHPVELDELRRLSSQHDLFLLEDAAHALPARYRGSLIGSGANPVAFSFYATKNLTTGEGGMLTGAPELLEQGRVVSLHGMSRDAWRRYERGGSWLYEVGTPGFKYNMSDLQAGIGLAQLAKLERHQERRREIVRSYTGAFRNVDALEVPTERAHVSHAWHLYVLRLRLNALRITRDEFIDELTKRNIGTSVHFIPVNLHPFYRDKYGYTPQSFPVAFSNFQRMVSIPLHPGLSDQDVADVIDAVLDIVNANQR